jgi:hypothetical protein
MNEPDVRQSSRFDKRGLHLSVWTIDELIGVLEDLRRLNPDCLIEGTQTLSEVSLSRKALITKGRTVGAGSNLAQALWNRNLL